MVGVGSVCSGCGVCWGRLGVNCSAWYRCSGRSRHAGCGCGCGCGWGRLSVGRVGFGVAGVLSWAVPVVPAVHGVRGVCGGRRRPGAGVQVRDLSCAGPGVLRGGVPCWSVSGPFWRVGLSRSRSRCPGPVRGRCPGRWESEIRWLESCGAGAGGGGCWGWSSGWVVYRPRPALALLRPRPRPRSRSALSCSALLRALLVFCAAWPCWGWVGVGFRGGWW